MDLEDQSISASAGRMRRDEKLWALLPSKDEPYDHNKLSEAETDALNEALGDGFGERNSLQDIDPLQLPGNVKTGLLDHRFWCTRNSEYDPDEYSDPFWSTDTDCPPPYESFPLEFTTRRLRIYFKNQFDRFCGQLVRERPGLALLEECRDEYIADAAALRIYEKPWYEVHALQFLDWIAFSSSNKEMLKHPVLTALCLSGFSGQLGRLVEQYYWRLRFEEAAITGTGTRNGASAGGAARAKRHKDEHAAWQGAASKIWARNRNLSKESVAEILKTELRLSRSARHIARYIVRP
jgi:hypothetical protein